MQFDFIRDVGEKIVAATGLETEAEIADGLEKYLKNLGFDADYLKVVYDDGLATVSGLAADEGTAEKIVLALGNSAGVDSVQDDLEIGETRSERVQDLAEAAEARAEEKRRQEARKSVFYTVESGDTLSKIAAEHYGDGTAWQAIFEANTPMLENPDLIYPGQVLRIPPQQKQK